MERKSSVGARFPSPDVFFGTSADLPRIVELDLAKIVPNPDQPRRSFDEEKLRELASSIAENGLIHPITVRKAEGETYMVIAGERRLRAFGLLERTTIPAIISDGSVDELALIENIQREDLSPIDEFQAVARLIEKHGYSQADAARVLGKSRVSINELLSLSALAPAIVEEAKTSKASKSMLIEVARAGDEAAQVRLWSQVQGGAKSVRALRAAKKPGASGKNTSPVGAALRAGRRFADALAQVPKSEDQVWKEVANLVEKLTPLLKELERKAR